ncbi:unnamed protein product [Meloidogyne enterolobii]|uniref:Uncharacterized protein n=1 Tax=Meloidogyne enterolobii TaxID=390850 RepID=A0ACB0Y3Y8_MELEN
MIWPKLFFLPPFFPFLFLHTFIYLLFRVLIYACLSLPLKFFFTFFILVFKYWTQSVFFYFALKIFFSPFLRMSDTFTFFIARLLPPFSYFYVKLRGNITVRKRKIFYNI